MTTHIALLRGINVGGHNSVAMADLRCFVEELGFGDVRTLLQTGNIVFTGTARTAAALERTLETESAKRLDLHAAYMIRTPKELASAIGDNPFPKEAAADPGHLIVMFLKNAPSPAAVKSLQAAIKGPELICAIRNQLYIVYPAGIGESRLTIKLIEDKLRTLGTGRNWNTIQKLAALAST